MFNRQEWKEMKNVFTIELIIQRAIKLISTNQLTDVLKTMKKFAFLLIALVDLLIKVSGNPHPLDPLSFSEVEAGSKIITKHFNGKFLQFPLIMLQEPPKRVLLPFFLSGKSPLGIGVRKAFVNVINPEDHKAYEIIVNLSNSRVETVSELGLGIWPMISFDEDDHISEAVMKDEKVIRKLIKTGINNLSSVKIDKWDFNSAGDRPQYLDSRMLQLYFTIKEGAEDNHFTRPFGFMVFFDVLKRQVLEILDLPIHGDSDASNREGDSYPHQPHNYDPVFFPKSFYRKGPNPITFTQAKGPSFKINGYEVEWQNFNFRIGFNAREGVTINHVTYNDNGRIRPLIYRAAISELFVPYGDPRPPYHWAAAYDGGTWGLGMLASTLRAPAECKSSSVHFFDTVRNLRSGAAVKVPQGICVFEEDAGILMRKHPESGKTYVVREQRLVVAFTTTIGNYEYTFKFIFNLDASIKFEAQLDGVLKTIFFTGKDIPNSATVMEKNVAAQFHQHIFVARIDADVDGVKNTVVMEDIVSTGPTGSPANPFGNGFKVSQTILKTPKEARTNANLATARTWSVIRNMKDTNTYTHTPMGYKLQVLNPVTLQLNKDSPLHEKCGFVDYTLWVTRQRDDQMYAGGRYLNGTGLPLWIEREGGTNIVDEDVVLWATFGVTHVPRIEDFPVMPAESVAIVFKPVNFFLQNPALTVPGEWFIPKETK